MGPDERSSPDADDHLKQSARGTGLRGGKLKRRGYTGISSLGGKTKKKTWKKRRLYCGNSCHRDPEGKKKKNGRKGERILGSSRSSQKETSRGREKKKEGNLSKSESGQRRQRPGISKGKHKKKVLC